MFITLLTEMRHVHKGFRGDCSLIETQPRSLIGGIPALVEALSGWVFGELHHSP